MTEKETSTVEESIEKKTSSIEELMLREKETERSRAIRLLQSADEYVLVTFHGGAMSTSAHGNVVVMSVAAAVTAKRAQSMVP